MEEGKGSSIADPLPDPPGAESSGWLLEFDGRQVGIPACGLVVGRSKACDLVIDHPEVSRRHVRLSPVQGRPWAFDLGSANGTLVDGTASPRARLDEGSRMWIGPVQMLVRRGDAPHPLRKEWETLRDSPAEALRDLLAATSATWSRSAPEAIVEVDGLEPGPLRSLLSEAAIAGLGHEADPRG